VYQQIIEKVIQTSQNDFEESGVDHTTLDEMKQVCCNLACISASAPCSPSSPLSQPYHELHHFSFLISHISCQIIPRIVFAGCSNRAVTVWTG
jgi:hypothetical protein